MNTTKLIYVFVGIAVVAGLVGVLLPDRVAAPVTDDVTETDEAVFCTMDAKQCPDGSYVGRTGPNCEFAACPAEVVSGLSNMITVTSPVADTVISSPVYISGEAVGPWFFEASSPVEIQDGNGTVLGQGYISAEGNWMTTNFVAFSGEVQFSLPVGVTDGVVIIKKDNPSGLSENDAEISIPVQFAQ